MLKFIKSLLIVALIVLLGATFWGLFAIWTGIYSVYSFPPSKDHPDGETLIVSRNQGEPMFDSPDYRPPVRKAAPKTGGLQLGAATKPAQPLKDRTLLTLPYVEWAYEKSLEPEQPATDK